MTMHASPELTPYTAGKYKKFENKFPSPYT